MRSWPPSMRALSYVRDMAENNMTYTCRVERVSAGSTDDDLVYTPGSRQTIYEGVCRIWEVTGAAAINIGDEDVTMQSTQLSIPWEVDVLPQRNDEVEITGGDGTDIQMYGKRFQIQGSAKAGQMRATRRFSVISLEKTNAS